MTYSITSKDSELKISEKGAEIISWKISDVEYIWQKNSKWWNKSSPILFPSIGFTKNNTFIHKGKQYEMPKHGFLKDSKIKVQQKSEDTIAFRFKTCEFNYPFNLTLDLEYKLKNRSLQITHTVENHDNSVAYYKLGYHPAFSFLHDEKLEQWEISTNGSLKGPFQMNENGLLKKSNNPGEMKFFRFQPESFANDALIFGANKLSSMELKNRKTGRCIKFEGLDFRNLAFWAPSGAPFICIEPWDGSPDFVNTNELIMNKKSALNIPANQTHRKSFTIYL